MRLRYGIRPTPENFDEDDYLDANPDVAAAVAAGHCISGRHHFDTLGEAEARLQRSRTPLDMSRALAPLDVVWGGVDVCDEDPTVEVVDDGVYIPFFDHNWDSGKETWGLYKDNQLIKNSAYIRGSGYHTVGQAWRYDYKVTEEAPADCYIYAGVMQTHIGHFLTSGIDRFWRSDRSAKFLVHGTVHPEAWFTLPFVAEALGALGLSAGDFVRFKRPTRIAKVIVPGPSFREQHSAHRIYGALGSQIGSRLKRGKTDRSGAGPIYLSKHRVQSGVWRFVNEEPLLERLDRAGVDILSPETLSLAEQIAILETRSHVIAPLGSMHHLSALCSKGVNFIILSQWNKIWSNFKLIDQIKGNPTHYFFPSAGVEMLPGNDQFQSMFELSDPAGIAEDLLRLCSV